MTRPRWIPHPAAWATAVALYVFMAGVGVAMAVVIPLLFELMLRSPRLAWLGILLVWLAPIVVAAAIHRVADIALDLGTSRPGSRAGWLGASSLWAGFVAWSTCLFVTLATSLVMLVVDPPPVEPDALHALGLEMTRGFQGVARSAVWIVLAACVYELQRAAGEGGGRT